jgi:hypothetical protein
MGTFLQETAEGIAVPTKKVLQAGDTLDQLSEGTCVGHGFLHWHNCRPTGYRTQGGHDDAVAWYDLATLRDPWDDNDVQPDSPNPDRSFGTSMQAGAEVAIEKGVALSYIWAATLDEIRTFIAMREGPVVMGTYWYNSMDDTDSDGYLRVDTSSGISGGHCWMVHGVHENYDFVAQNSWGNDWGQEGHFKITWGDMEKLLNVGGEAVAMVQTKVLPKAV